MDYLNGMLNGLAIWTTLKKDNFERSIVGKNNKLSLLSPRVLGLGEGGN